MLYPLLIIKDINLALNVPLSTYFSFILNKRMILLKPMHSIFSQTLKRFKIMMRHFIQVLEYNYFFYVI